MKTIHRNKGFTMVELIVVVAIVTVLAGMAIPIYSSYVDKAKLTLSLSALSILKKALDSYSMEHGDYPGTLDFSAFTDQNGVAIADASVIDQIKGNVFSFDSYVVAASTYTLVAKGVDSSHTVITVTPDNITH